MSRLQHLLVRILRALLPRNKHDKRRARVLAALGYPAIAPVVPELLEWLQDGNWPVADVVVPFMVRIGAPIAPQVRDVLRTDDHIWKFWLLTAVVARSPSLAAALREDLRRLATEANDDEDAQEVAEQAREILAALAS